MKGPSVMEGSRVVEHPYWWRDTPPKQLDFDPVDSDADVAIIGSGITGLRAALTLARAGRRVIVLEAGAAGSGASRRNAGFLGRVLKKSYSKLLKQVGPERAGRVYTELNDAYQSTLAFIEAEQIDCQAERCGRFVAATSPAHLDAMEREMGIMERDLGFGYRLIPKSDVRSEMGSDSYYGGIVVPDLGALHPGLYHEGILERALSSGVEVRTGSRVLSLAKNNGKFTLNTQKYKITAENIVVATNGYTARDMPWWARRLVPFTGFMAATEILDPHCLAELIPHRRTIIDSNSNIDFFRPAPNSDRLLFGGATGSRLKTSAAIRDRLRERLLRIYPQLAGVQFSAIWSGQCAGTFDMMPHLGCHDGIWYGVGYNFAGVPMGGYFGEKIARSILSLPDADTIFSEDQFRPVPFGHHPLTVPAIMKLLDWKDKVSAKPWRT